MFQSPRLFQRSGLHRSEDYWIGWERRFQAANPLFLLQLAMSRWHADSLFVLHRALDSSQSTDSLWDSLLLKRMLLFQPHPVRDLLKQSPDKLYRRKRSGFFAWKQKQAPSTLLERDQSQLDYEHTHAAIWSNSLATFINHSPSNLVWISSFLHHSSDMSHFQIELLSLWSDEWARSDLAPIPWRHKDTKASWTQKQFWEPQFPTKTAHCLFSLYSEKRTPLRRLFQQPAHWSFYCQLLHSLSDLYFISGLWS